MNINMTAQSIDNITVGLAKYNYIMNQLRKTNVATDLDFQKKYNGFYRMRQRPAEYYSIYFDYMEQKKNTGVTFEEVLLYIYSKLGRIESSFSSKLVATIDPNKPVWDEFVLQNLGISKPTTYSKNRIEKTIDIYNKIDRFYVEFLKTKECINLLQEFDRYFLNTQLTDTKKIDLMLWQSRE